jgi:hypothetical protein
MLDTIKGYFQDIRILRHNLQIIKDQNEVRLEHATLPQKECSECFLLIDERARRCPYCTTILIA